MNYKGSIISGVFILGFVLLAWAISTSALTLPVADKPSSTKNLTLVQPDSQRSGLQTFTTPDHVFSLSFPSSWTITPNSSTDNKSQTKAWTISQSENQLQLEVAVIPKSEVQELDLMFSCKDSQLIKCQEVSYRHTTLTEVNLILPIDQNQMNYYFYDAGNLFYTIAVVGEIQTNTTLLQDILDSVLINN